MALTETRITDPDLVKWLKQYAAARDEKLETIVAEALGEYRERIAALAGAKATVAADKIHGAEQALAETLPVDTGPKAVETVPLTPMPVPPMVPGPEEELF